ncbi:MAG: GNAT family N-acetyltransferase [Opitutales bacterium]
MSTLGLQAMSAADYRDWMTIIVPDYAAEKVAGGAWPRAEALARSQEALAKLLPQGVATPENWLCTLVSADTRERAGFLWFARQEQTAYLYDLYILAAQRRRGYGRQAMQLLETKARTMGFAGIALHVFGHNEAARDLYLSEGYRITDLNMRKDLPPAPA